MRSVRNIQRKELVSSERYFVEMGYASGGMAFLFLRSVREFLTFFLRPRQYLVLTLEQLYVLGVKSIPLTLIAGAAIGSVFALQFGYGMKRFGGTLYVPNLVGIAMFRELGPALTSLLLAGRIGAGMSSELASMKVTEQVDAIRAMGTSPNSTLVIPRVLACLISLPILTLLSDYVAIAASMLVCDKEFMIQPAYYLNKTIRVLNVADVTTGLFKALVFGFFVAIIGCWKGLNAGEGTKGVGSATTWVVVTASTVIMICDVLLSRIFILLRLYH
jgi:phospholipid/cholesterol/gamma-HCH transport system permease protein